MPSTLAFDSRGRLTLPRKLRQGLGDHVVAIQTPHGVVLHPVPRHVRIGVKARDASGDDAAVSEV